MAKYTRVNSSEREQIAALSARLGDARLRTLLTGESSGDHPERSRLIGRRRLNNLTSGSGKLSQAERERLDVVSKNVRTIELLANRGEKLGIQSFKTNRAVRTFLIHGKAKDAPRTPGPNEIRAIRALRFLGVDTDTGTFYIKGVTV